MPSNAAILARISQIDATLESGVIVDKIDGHELRIDPESLRKERTRLARRLKRPVVCGIKTGGFQ